MVALVITDTIIETVEFINQSIILPLTVVIFISLLYFVMFLRRNDPDVIKSKIFLRSDEFIKAFTILAITAFILVFHVFLIYISNFIAINSRDTLLFISRFQQLLGLILTILLVLFAYKIFRVIR